MVRRRHAERQLATRSLSRRACNFRNAGLPARHTAGVQLSTALAAVADDLRGGGQGTTEADLEEALEVIRSAGVALPPGAAKAAIGILRWDDQPTDEFDADLRLLERRVRSRFADDDSGAEAGDPLGPIPLAGLLTATYPPARDERQASWCSSTGCVAGAPGGRSLETRADAHAG